MKKSSKATNKQPVQQAVQIADETDGNDITSKSCQDWGNVYTRMSEYKKAIKYYQKAREISPDLEGNEVEVEAYQWLAYNHIQAGQYQESIKYYNEVVELASELGDKCKKIDAYMGLGSAFSYTREFESSQEYFIRALAVAIQLNDKGLQKEVYRNLGDVYYKSYKFDAAVKSYLKVKDISHDLGKTKEEVNACLMLGDIFQELKQHDKAIESYQETLNICEKLEDKENFMQVVTIQRLGTLYLTLASACCKDGDVKAITWYENALNIFGKEPNDHRLLYEKALTGLKAITWFRIGDAEAKAMESIQKAQKFAQDTNTGIIIINCYILSFEIDIQTNIIWTYLSSST
jgi:tetratricopeptide (TPR) repeat protein